MNKQLRWSQITDLCKQKEIVSVTEIADALLISPATVRRDLQEMEDLGMIIRTHGGAKITGDQTEEPSMILKAESNSSEKSRSHMLQQSLSKTIRWYIWMQEVLHTQ